MNNFAMGGDGMPETKPGKSWIATAVWVVLIMIAAMQGVPYLLLALLLLPPVSATLAYTAGWTGPAAVCLMAGGACVYLVPGISLAVLLPWCILSAVIACVPLRRKKLRPLLWAGLCLGAGAGMLALLGSFFQEGVVPGLAQAMTDMINESPERDLILINAYRMGLSRLDVSDNWNMVLQLTGILSPEVRNELLFSLRVSMEETLPSILCDGLVYDTAITVLLCTLLPDWRRRKNGEPGELPGMEKWYIPRGLGLAISALCIGWLIAAMSDGGPDLYFGLMCTAVFRAAYVIQGVCLLLWVERKMGIRSVIRHVWAVALSLLAPIVPLIMGLIDQGRDSRNLRPKKEAESL